MITFCDSDDLLLGDHLAALVQVHDRRRVGLVTANAYYLYPGELSRSKLRYRGRFPSPAETADGDPRAELPVDPDAISTASPRRDRSSSQSRSDKRRTGTSGCGPSFMGIGWHSNQDRYQSSASVPTVSRATGMPWTPTLSASSTGSSIRLRLTNEELAYLRRRRAGPGPRKLGRAGGVALREGRYRDAARLYREAAALTSSERMLVWKAPRHVAGARPDGSLDTRATASYRKDARSRRGPHPMTETGVAAARRWRTLVTASVDHKRERHGSRRCLPLHREPLPKPTSSCPLRASDRRSLPVNARSAGTLNVGSPPPFPETLEHAHRFGLDLSGHRARPRPRGREHG